MAEEIAVLDRQKEALKELGDPELVIKCVLSLVRLYPHLMVNLAPQIGDQRVPIWFRPYLMLKEYEREGEKSQVYRAFSAEVRGRKLKVVDLAFLEPEESEAFGYARAIRQFCAQKNLTASLGGGHDYPGRYIPLPKEGNLSGWRFRRSRTRAG